MHCIYIVLLSVLLALSSHASSSGNPEKVSKPNVIIIYGDDVGYADIGVNGSTMIPTPNIDRLAEEGLNFTDGHCTAATCTPSRFSMLTGVHAFRYDARILPPDAPLLIPTDIMTLPKLFNKAGYHTAVIGKWHLGIGSRDKPNDWNGEVKPGPLEIGFDYSFLLPYTNDRVPCVYLRNHRVVNLDPADPLYVGRKPADVKKSGSTEYPDGKKNREAMTYYPSSHGHDHSIINGIGRIGYQSGGRVALWDDEEMADVFVAEAGAYIAARKDQPFFLYFSSQDIHVPRTPHPRFKGKSKLGYRGDAMVQLDWTVGAIMKLLEDHGLTENTIVLFSSDNGPVYDDGYVDGTTVKPRRGEVDRGHDGSGIWRGGKYQIYEGGTRVPLIIRWPARIEPGTSSALVSQIDLLASFAALLEMDLAAGDAPDSRNVLEAFLGRDPEGLDYMLEEAYGLALRHGEWKFIAKGKSPRALYNLADDPGEQKNRAETEPEKAAGMEALLDKLKDGAGMRETFSGE